MHLAVLMPAFDEGQRLLETLQDVASIATRVDVVLFLVDDGSARPIDFETVANAARPARVVLARHVANLGQGAALETARRMALDAKWQAEPFDVYVTMDADGQHRAEDVMALAKAIFEGGADVALGDRFAGDSEVPFGRRALLGFARAFERWTTGLRLSDAHNGLRAFAPDALAGLRLRQNRMAHATEITRALSRSRSLRVVEVPVSVRYTRESLAKGQSGAGALAIVVDLVQGFLFGK